MSEGENAAVAPDKVHSDRQQGKAQDLAEELDQRVRQGAAAAAKGIVGQRHVDHEGRQQRKDHQHGDQR